MRRLILLLFAALVLTVPAAAAEEDVPLYDTDRMVTALPETAAEQLEGFSPTEQIPLGSGVRKIFGRALESADSAIAASARTAALVVVIVLRRNVISWAGWMLAIASFVYMIQTAMFGLNYYAGSLSDDMRLEVGRYTVAELAEATEYYRDKANALSTQVSRDGNGVASFASFGELAQQAGDGFETLTYEYYYPVFAGSTQPVKELGWADMYTSMGITGFTCGITGEAAVNPQIPDVTLPFTMCHEMAHRMCIAPERDANFAAFLAASVNSSVEFRYSAYFMAYRYCYNVLSTANSTEAAAAAGRISSGVSAEMLRDIQYYDAFFSSKKDDTATKVADTVNDTYLKASGDSAGIQSYGQVCDLLVNWHIDQVVLPELAVEVEPFDPYDETQVDLTGIVNAGGGNG